MSIMLITHKITIKVDPLLRVPILPLFRLRQHLIKILQLLLIRHLPNRDQELLQLLEIQQLIIIPIEQTEVALVLDLFL